MPKVQILLSHALRVSDDFTKMVAEYAQAMERHAHTTGEPAPAAPNPLVEHAVARIQEPGKADRFVPDYEIIDDTPSLDERKSRLSLEVAARVHKEIERIDPPLLRRIGHIRLRESLNKPEEHRDGDDHELIKEAETKNDLVTKLHHYMAEVDEQIHYLTEDNIDVWKAPDLPSL